MLIDGRNEVYMIDRDNSVFHVANLEFPYRKDMRIHLSNTLLDGVRLQPRNSFSNPFTKHFSQTYVYDRRVYVVTCFL